VAGRHDGRLSGETLTQQTWWRSVFSEQRRVWAACYAGPCERRRLFLPEHEGPPDLRERGVVVA